MTIDFAIPQEARMHRQRVRQWVHNECLPAEKEMLAGKDFKTVLAALRKKARAQAGTARRSRMSRFRFTRD